MKDASRSFNDKSHTFKSIKEVERALAQNNLEMNVRFIRDAILTDSDSARESYYWFDDFFTISGDHMPNSKEIHLEYTTLLALYNKYKSECNYKPLAYKQWQDIWDTLFPHVKIRAYKQVRSSTNIYSYL